MANSFHLILGGARSGKSKLAERLCSKSGRPVIYIATATAGDEEMAKRIQHHQQHRATHWRIIEEPTALFSAIQTCQEPDCCILVDCLTLWLSNCLHANCWQQQRQLFFEGLSTIQSQIVFVSNETGLGIIPMGSLTRQFVDEAGFMHQQLASLCDKVTLCVAGLPMELK